MTTVIAIIGCKCAALGSSSVIDATPTSQASAIGCSLAKQVKPLLKHDVGSQAS